MPLKESPELDDAQRRITVAEFHVTDGVPPRPLELSECERDHDWISQQAQMIHIVGRGSAQADVDLKMVFSHV